MCDYAFCAGDDLSQDNDFVVGLQPGDLTKYMSVPWQADFNECSTQPIDITYEAWNKIYPDSDNDKLLSRERRVWETLWWLAHRPMQTWVVASVENGEPNYVWRDWTPGVPQTNAGNQKMVSEWKRLGFILRNPYQVPRKCFNYVRKHFPGQRVAFVYEAGPTGFGLGDQGFLLSALKVRNDPTVRYLILMPRLQR